MGAIQSLGALTTVAESWTPTATYGSLTLYDRYSYDYQTIYRTQPNVRTVVDFLARNVAQLGLHVFRRVGENDRQRLRDHPLATLLGQPNAFTTRYRLIESMMIDFGIFWNAYWLKVKAGGKLALLRVPPELVSVYGGLIPTRYEIDLATQTLKPTPDQIVHFRGHSPDSAIKGLAPMETLRRIIAEEQASGEYREYYWRNGARMAGIIERPADAPEWSDAARARFTAEFEALYSAVTQSGKTAILEDGMTWKQATFNAQESEYLAGRKLTREEVARAYHVPLPMVGILDHATFSNIKEQHKNLYQDCLGPWLKMIEEDIELQLLPDFPDREGVYVEFNIQEKLAGSFEEQTQAMQSAIGRPWMTADEGRARMNLPSIGGDAGRLVTPLNVLIGGQASPRDSAPKSLPHLKADGELDPTLLEARRKHVEKWREVISAYFRRQERAMIGRVPAKAAKADIGEVWSDGDRWDRELAADFLRLNTATATVWAEWVAEQLGAEIDADLMLDYLSTNARIAAEEINATTQAQIATALTDEAPKDAVRALFEIAATSRAAQIAVRAVTHMANFGSAEGARQGGLKTKTWQVNSGNPRENHAAMNGSTVGIGELFSNGMRWPGDPAGGAANNAHCFPGSVVVNASAVERAYRRWYEGELVILTTASGRRLPATPNHPILTPLGWRALHFLAEGDYVVGCLGREHIAGPDPNIDYVDALIGKVFDLLAVNGATQRVAGVIEQFHGDGQDGDVDIVTADSQLRNGLQATILQPSSQQPLALANIPERLLLSQGVLDHLGFGAFAPANGGMRGRSLTTPVGGAPLHIADKLGLPVTAGRHAGLEQATANSTPAAAEAPGDGLFRLAGQIALDQIIRVERVPYAGHVYNLQTREGLYSANGIIAHNCECSVRFGR